MKFSLLSRLRSDQRGATLVEFALISPVLLTIILGSMDLARTLYATSVIEGELQKAARASSLETGSSGESQASIDEKITKQLQKVSTASKLTFTRKAYESYKMVEARKEEFNDINANGKCDKGETFVDSNGNGGWDLDAGMSGAGGSKDVLIYTVDAKLPRVFPMNKLLGWEDTINITSTALLRNQPYAGDGPAQATGTC